MFTTCVFQDVDLSGERLNLGTLRSSATRALSTRQHSFAVSSGMSCGHASGDVVVVPLHNILLRGRTTYFLALGQTSEWSKWSNSIHGLGVILIPQSPLKKNVFPLRNTGALPGVTTLLMEGSKWSKLLRKHVTIM